MREIKFRAWDKIKNTMRKVDYIDWSEQDVGCGDGMFILMQNCTLTQWTGLKDANGVEIYEGDILGREKDDTESRVSHHIVEWHDTGFMGRQVCSYSSYIGLDVWTQHKDGYVVLGNIYENPELLQEETK